MMGITSADCFLACINHNYCILSVVKLVVYTCTFQFAEHRPQLKSNEFLFHLE